MDNEMVIVSACLAGFNCKYNGTNNYNEKIFELVKEGKAIPVCAEILGGLTTPRLPAEIVIQDAKRYVLNNKGEDVTEAFEKGAKNIAEFAEKMGIKKAILKSKSPSCGKGKIYDGSFKGRIVDGNGILTQILLDKDIQVISSDEY